MENCSGGIANRNADLFDTLQTIDDERFVAIVERLVSREEQRHRSFGIKDVAQLFAVCSAPQSSAPSTDTRVAKAPLSLEQNLDYN